MSRQRLKPTLSEGASIPCPRCGGSGHIRDTESSALQILRIIQEESMKDNTAAVHAQVPVEVASFLLNEKRSEIAKIELKQRLNVLLVPNRSLETPHYKIERLKHDDPRLDRIEASYKMAEEIEDPTTVTRRSQEPTNKQTPVIKGVLPDAPAPVAPPKPEAAPAPAPAAPVAAPATSGGFFGWLKKLFGVAPATPAPAATPEKKEEKAREGREGRGGDRNRRGGRRGERGERGEGQERNGRRPQGEGRAERPEGEQRAPRPERAERQPRERRPDQRAEASIAPTPEGAGTEQESRTERAPRAERGEGRRERGERGEGRRERGERRERAPEPNLNVAAAAATEATAEDSAQPTAEAPATENNGERRERRSRDRYGRDRRERNGEARAETTDNTEQVTAAEGSEPPAEQEQRPQRSYFDRAGAAPVPQAAEAAPAPVAAAPEVSTPAAAASAGMPRVQSYTLPLSDLQQIASGSGLEWVNSDADKVAAVQAAIAAEPKPVHVPRERPPVVVIDEGPLVLVETRKDLADMKLPF
jgi:ribonuclease E